MLFILWLMNLNIKLYIVKNTLLIFLIFLFPLLINNTMNNNLTVIVYNNNLTAWFSLKYVSHVDSHSQFNNISKKCLETWKMFHNKDVLVCPTSWYATPGKKETQNQSAASWHCWAVDWLRICVCVERVCMCVLYKAHCSAAFLNWCSAGSSPLMVCRTRGT